MQRRALGVILAAFLMAGCADDAPPLVTPTPSSSSSAAASPPFYGEATCSNALLFQFVDYGQTDAYLPPGFHPRDPQGFLKTEVAFGQAGVIFMALDCASPEAGPLEAAFLGIFVEAPAVEGLDPAPFNFYELARYGSRAEFGGALVAARWPLSEANLTLQSLQPAGEPVDVLATVTDAEGTVAQVAGTVATPVMVGAGPTRFWHQDRHGLAYIEYGADLDARVGPGACRARAGTPLAAFVGQPLAGDYSCPGLVGVGTADPVVAVLRGLALNATFHRLPGASAA